MASSPETAPSKKTSNNSTTSPPSDSSKSDSSPPPTPSSSSPSHPPPGKSPSPSPPPSPLPDSKSPPPPPSSQKSPQPSSPPPSSPPPSSPPPSSPPPSSPPPSSPPRSSPPPPRSSPPPPSPPTSSPPPSPPPPPPDKDKGSPPSPTSPPPDSDSDSSPPPPPSEATSEPPSSSSSPLTPSPPPSTGTPTPTPAAVFSPPPSINALSPPGVPKLVPPPPRSSPSSSNSLSRSSGSSTNHAGIIAGGAVGGALVLAVMVVVLLCILRKRRKPAYYIETTTLPSAGGGPAEHLVKVPPPPGVMVPPPAGWGPTPSNSNHPSPAFSDARQLPTPISPNMNLGRSQFSYDELATATGGFSQSKLLGQGGFGYVHKGVLPNGQEVAVKSLKSGSGQGEREFQAEVEIISRVHHRHLVSLVGYCMTNEQRMLVYEFVPNRTLEFHLHGKGQPVMDWATRLRIAVGSAKGLAYLHEDCHPKIIHRDIKAANILLDNNFEAMVADFGLAKLSSDNITHVSTRVMGTFGYLAPEYASSGKLTEKSDVFSYGVMLLELITGRRPLDPTNKLMEDSLVDWARPLMTKAIESGNYDELVDPRLEGNYFPREMAHMVSVAASSIRHSARMRPRMSQIVRTLEGEQLSLDDQISKPGQSAAFGVTQAYDTRAYNADMLKFKKMVMSSQEFPTSEFGDSTSEYGQYSTNSDSDANYHSDNAQNV